MSQLLVFVKATITFPSNGVMLTSIKGLSIVSQVICFRSHCIPDRSHSSANIGPLRIHLSGLYMCTIDFLSLCRWSHNNVSYRDLIFCLRGLHCLLSVYLKAEGLWSSLGRPGVSPEAKVTNYLQTDVTLIQLNASKYPFRWAPVLVTQPVYMDPCIVFVLANSRIVSCSERYCWQIR